MASSARFDRQGFFLIGHDLFRRPSVPAGSVTVLGQSTAGMIIAYLLSSGNSREEVLPMRMFSKIVLVTLISAAAARAEVDAKTARTWKAKCAACHGADGKGETDMGKTAKLADLASADWQKSKTDAQIKSVIESGATKNGVEMEAYKDTLDAAQIAAVVQYIRTLK